MRSNRNTRVGVILIGLALLLLALIVFRRQPAPPPVAVNPVPTENVAMNTGPGANRVARANTLIPARSIITPDMITWVSAPPGEHDAIAQSYVTDPSGVNGYITSREISPNADIRPATDLVGHISEVGIAAALNPGTRAMVIPLNKPTVHDLIKVGDFVDVIGAFDGQESRSIVQNVRVLAVDVFGKDYPQTSVAQRGDYKAAPKGGIATANPASPAPGGAPAAQGQPGAPTPTPAPAPAANGQPPAKPEPSVTLEVLPQQATVLSLAQSAGAALDLILRPRPAIVSTVPEVRVAAITKASLAPYANKIKQGASPERQTANFVKTGGQALRDFRRGMEVMAGDRTGINPNGTGGRRVYPSDGPPLFPPTSGTVTPARTDDFRPAPPPTYTIPVYGDGKIVRYDTVVKPDSSN